MLIFFIIGLVWPVLHYHVRYPTFIVNDYFNSPASVKGIVTKVSSGLFGNTVITVRLTKVGDKNLYPLSRLQSEIAIPATIRVGRNDLFSGDVQLSVKRFRQNISQTSRIFRSFYNGELYRGKVIDDASVVISSVNNNGALNNIGLSKHAWLFESLTTGNKQEMPSEFRRQITQLGIGHLFAISGLHMGIVFGFSFLFIKFASVCLCRSQFIDHIKLATVFSMLVCFGYLYLCDFAVSATRAFIMLSFISVSYLTMHKALSWQSLLLALLCVLAIDPFSLLDVGLYFSFIAVFALFCAFKFAHMFAITGYVKLLLLSQGSIGLFVSPLSIYFFDGVSSVSFVANLIVIPIFCLLLVPLLIICYILLVCFAERVVGTVDSIMSFFVDGLMVFPVENTWQAIAINVHLLVAFCLFLILLMLPSKLKYLCSLPLFIVILDHQFIEKPIAEVHVFDVGHGSAIAIKQHDKVVLYDLGNRFGDFSYTKSLLLPYLLKYRIREVLVIVSHDDSDHKGDLSVLHDQPFTLNVLASGLINTVCKLNYNSDGIEIKSIWPAQLQQTDNNNSCVALVTINKTNLLLTGDIEKQVEPYVITRLPHKPIDIMLSPHHGSNSSSSDEFIKATKPTWVIHSARRYDHWRLPNINTVTRYATNNVNQASTQNGAITIKIFDDKYTISQHNTLQSYWFLYI